LKGGNAKGRTFLEDLSNYAPSVRPRATKFGVGEHVSGGGKYATFLRGGARPNVPRIFWTLLLTPILVRPRATKFGMVTYMGEERVSRVNNAPKLGTEGTKGLQNC